MPDFPGSSSDSGFHRQRRNLIAGSIALLFMHVADVKLTSQFSAMGLTFNIAKPNAIYWFLWSAVIYWLIRFYQYHRITRPAQLQTEARDYMVRRLRMRAIDFITPERPHFVPPDVKEGEAIELVPHNFSPINFQRFKFEAIVAPAWLISDESGKRELRHTGEHRVVISGWHLWQARIVGYVKAAINTPYFTEYLAPYIFFAMPLFYTGYHFIKG